MVRGERKKGVQNSEQNKEHVIGSEMKKIRLQSEEEGEQQIKDVIDKKSKCQKVKLSTSSPMVVVSSQKWHQMDK